MNYILYGEQYPMIKKRLKKVLHESVGEVDDFNVVKFDYSPEKVDEIIDEASMLPLGYDSKAVVIDNASFLEAKANKEIVNYDNNIELDEYTAIIDLIDLKSVLDSCKEDHITFNFGNGQAIVIQRPFVYNVIPEMIV